MLLDTKIHSLEQDAWIRLIKTCFPLIKVKLCTDKECTDKSTEANIFGSPETLAMLKKKSPIKQSKMTLDFNPSSDCGSSPDYLPIFQNKPKTFDSDEYVSYLKTDSLGRAVIHCDMITTTFDILQGQFLLSGMAVIADQQTSGRGRSANKWLSPEGNIATFLIVPISPFYDKYYGLRMTPYASPTGM